jgi:hypothetical protein
MPSQNAARAARSSSPAPSLISYSRSNASNDASVRPLSIADHASRSASSASSGVAAFASENASKASAHARRAYASRPIDVEV